jgi:hypothetical protein
MVDQVLFAESIFLICASLVETNCGCEPGCKDERLQRCWRFVTVGDVLPKRNVLVLKRPTVNTSRDGMDGIPISLEEAISYVPCREKIDEGGHLADLTEEETA